MSEIEEKNIFDPGSRRLAAIFEYLSLKDLICLKESAVGFHYAILIILRKFGEISLRSFESFEQTKTFFRDMPFDIKKLDMVLNERSLKNRILIECVERS